MGGRDERLWIELPLLSCANSPVSEFRVWIVIVIPAGPPNQVLRINYVFAQGAIRVTISKKNISSSGVPVRRPLIILPGVEVGWPGAISCRILKSPSISDHDHFGGTPHTTVTD